MLNDYVIVIWKCWSFHLSIKKKKKKRHSKTGEKKEMETKFTMASMVWSVFGQNKTFQPEEIMSEVWYNTGFLKSKKWDKDIIGGWGNVIHVY